MNFMFIFVLLMSVFVLQGDARCAKNGSPCKWNGFGNCCSGFCYQQVGWKVGYCKKR